MICESEIIVIHSVERAAAGTSTSVAQFQMLQSRSHCSGRLSGPGSAQQNSLAQHSGSSQFHKSFAEPAGSRWQSFSNAPSSKRWQSFSNVHSSNRWQCRNSTCTASAAQQDCVVLGGGIGGLVTAAKLAQSGYRVTVCEQNEQLGGRCQTVSFEGCRFDTGPSLLLLPQVYQETFAWLGSSITEHVQLARVEPAAYRVWFADSFDSSSQAKEVASLDLFYDVQRMVEQLERVEPGAGGRSAVVAAAQHVAAQHSVAPKEMSSRTGTPLCAVSCSLVSLHEHTQLGWGPTCSVLKDPQPDPWIF